MDPSFPNPCTIRRSSATASRCGSSAAMRAAASMRRPPSVWRLDAGAEAWVDDQPLPEARGAGAAAWDGSRIVYAGGVGSGSVSGAVFAFEDGAWSQVARLANPREHLAATSDGEGSVFVVGGRVGGLDGNLATADLVEGTLSHDDRRAADADAAASQRSGGRPSARASSAGSHPAARTRRSSASTSTATSRSCRTWAGRATGSAPRSSTAPPMSRSAAISPACSSARPWSHSRCHSLSGSAGNPSLWRLFADASNEAEPSPQTRATAGRDPIPVVRLPLISHAARDGRRPGAQRRSRRRRRQALSPSQD